MSADHAFEAGTVLRRYGFDCLMVRGSKAAEWNLRRLPHQGSHPDVYEERILDNLRKAAAWSEMMADQNAPAGDPELRREIQTRYFEQAWQAVRHWVTQDPLMFRHEYYC